MTSASDENPPAASGRLAHWWNDVRREIRQPDSDLRFRITRWCVAFGVAIPVLVMYFLMTTFNIQRYEYGGIETLALWTAIDDRIPLWPAMFWPYSLYYVLALMPAFLAKDRRDLLEMAVSYALVTMTAWVAWYLIPVRMEYPDLGSCAGFNCGLLAGLYETDGGVNVFPSLHAAHSVLVASIFWTHRHRVPDWLMASVLLMAIGVSISTVLLKQHYFVDVPAGVLLAIGAWGITRWATAAFVYNETPTTHEVRAG